MPVPAFRNSRSRVRRRRSHHALKRLQLIKDKVTGEFRLPHFAVAKKEESSAAVAPVKSKKTAAEPVVEAGETEKK